jgi:biopolymer transport protein ExbD
MAFKEIKLSEDVAPNLVPMVDIMFLLLLFFMLNADMSQRELEDVLPPVATAADEDKEDQAIGEARITVNVHVSPDGPERPPGTDVLTYIDDQFWRITVSGQSYSFDKPGLDRLRQRLEEMASTKRENPNDRNSPSARILMIRADKQAPYKLVQKVVEQAAMAKIYKIEVAAYIPKDELNKR